MVEDVGRNVTYLGLNDTFQNASIRTNITILDLLARRNMPVIAVYSSLFCVAAIGNLTVFISLFRSRYRKSRISLMIRHLTIADLIVTFVMIPIEMDMDVLFSSSSIEDDEIDNVVFYSE
ncbi:hypothetical protein NQ317_000939 [Molorchus minor]|uniref:G-protein coupled receptors family 1 profile domain-containing protein n=1 Tax=Molorchus minor TaxID=1323400 RepID=A0ABQ9JGK9_9CUCU|nr:hypothetical protein NQ317_000939 [Molorchus minor]